MALTSCKISSRAATSKLQARRNRPRSWLLSLAQLLPLERDNPGLQKPSRLACSAAHLFLDLMDRCIDRTGVAECVPVQSRLSITPTPAERDRSAVCKRAEGEAYALKYSAQTRAFTLGLTSTIEEPLSSNLAMNSQEGGFKFHQRHYLCSRLRGDQGLKSNLEGGMTPTQSQSHPDFPTGDGASRGCQDPSVAASPHITHSNRSACKCFTNPEPQKGLKYLSITLPPRCPPRSPRNLAGRIAIEIAGTANVLRKIKPQPWKQ